MCITDEILILLKENSLMKYFLRIPYNKLKMPFIGMNYFLLLSMKNYYILISIKKPKI